MSVLSSPALPSRSAVALLAAVFAALALLYALTTPPFEAPDETLHFFYAHHLRAGRGLPVLPPSPQDGWGQEGAQPPLAYLLFALPALLTPADAAPRDLLANPYAAPGRLAPPDNVNWHILRPEQRAFPGDGLTRGLRAARLVSVTAGVLAVVGAARLAGFVLGDRTLAVAAAAVMAFTPQFLFLSGAVTNDIVTVALATWVLALAAEGLTMPLARSRLAALGGLTGLLLLAKVSGALVVAPALAALLLAPYVPLRKRLVQAAGVLGTAAVLWGWWPLRNLLLYGDPLGLSVHLATIGHRPAPPTLAEFLTGGAFAAVFMSYWGLFGWQSVPLPQPVYLALAALTGAALAGLLALALRRLLVFRSGGNREGRSPFRSGGHAALVLATAALMVAGLGAWNAQVYAAQGRLLFPALAPFSILLTAGVTVLTPPCWRPGVARLLAAGLLAVSAAAPLGVIAPRYALPQPRVAAPDAPVLARFGDGLVLETARVTPAAALPGAPVTVELAWRVERPLEQDYTVGVQLTSPAWEPLARRDSFPGGGLTATSLWAPGMTYLDRHPLVLDRDAARPQQAQVAITVYDPRTARPLPATDARGHPTGAAVPVARLRVPPLPASPPPTVRAVGRFPGLGVEVLRDQPDSSVVGLGGPLDVALRWQVTAEGDRTGDRRVSLQLLDDRGRLRAQHDGVPGGGRFPMSAWGPGDLVDDRYRLAWPADLAPGTYQLLLIVYDGERGSRASVLAADGTLGDALPLGTVTMVQEAQR